MVDAVVLAGAANDGKLAMCDDAEYEALISIQGRPMVSYVLNTLRRCEQIGTIVLVCPKEVSESIDPISDLVSVEARGALLPGMAKAAGAPLGFIPGRPLVPTLPARVGRSPFGRYVHRRER